MPTSTSPSARWVIRRTPRVWARSPQSATDWVRRSWSEPAVSVRPRGLPYSSSSDISSESRVVGSRRLSSARRTVSSPTSRPALRASRRWRRADCAPHAQAAHQVAERSHHLQAGALLLSPPALGDVAEAPHPADAPCRRCAAAANTVRTPAVLEFEHVLALRVRLRVQLPHAGDEVFRVEELIEHRADRPPVVRLSITSGDSRHISTKRWLNTTILPPSSTTRRPSAVDSSVA